MGYDELPETTTTLVDLDESLFPPNHVSPNPQLIHRLPAFAKNTFRSYKQSNQKIDAFRLCLDTDWYGLSGLAAKWTSKALKLGATDLTFRLLRTRDSPPIFIPFDEVFGAENIVSLHLETLSVDHRLESVKCSNLKSLTLTDMSMRSESFFNIVSSCPLIEILSLSNIGKHYEYGNNGPGIPDGSKVSLPKLTSLVLSYVCEHEILNLFLGRDSSSRFPVLKELTLGLYLPDLGNERDTCFVSIHSLEIFNFSAYYDSEKEDTSPMFEFEFDVPSIRKFTFEGNCIPNLSFSSTSTDQWEESRVEFTRDQKLSALWFCELRNFLKELRRSKVHLGLHLHCEESFFDYEAGDIEGLDLVELEDLTLDTEDLPRLSFDAILDGLFRICRPKMITQYESPRNNNDIFLCRALTGQVMQLKSLLIISQFMLSLLDLEEVSAQKFFEDDGTWIPQPLDTILDDSERRFRFQLKWKPYCSLITS